MNSRIAYGNIILRVIFITMTSLLIAYLFFNTGLYPLASLISVILIIQVIALIYSLNRTNRKITYFFDAVRNEDSTLHFPEDIKDPTELALNSSLNKVNKMIQTARKDQISQEKYYSHILERAVTGFISFDEEGHILLCNMAAKKLLGYEQLNHIEQLKKGSDKVYDAFIGLESGGSKVVKLLSEKETVQLSLKASTITIKEKTLTLVAIQNIRDELEDQEIESWIRLIRVLTHEIMNSVAPITSIAGTLSEVYKDEEKTKLVLPEKVIENTINGLNIISQRGNGLMAFVDSYRKLTKVPVPKKKYFKVLDFFESIRMLVSQEENFKVVKFVIEVPDENLNLLADQEQLTQVMINLVKNALDAVKESKQPQITLRAEQLERIEISVIDNGSGINQETMEQIFIPFFTTKEKGNGIGLSLSHHIVRMHGGKLLAESDEKSGTTFKLVL